ncbi:MAG: CHAT domain-containing protein, partial [Thermoanaerobaculia bacterium]|nr:CHAT domain-containing protein [Thermoanaerobaculia bacterium]
CFNNALFYKGFVQEAVSLIRHQVHSDTTTAKQYESLAGLRRRLAQEYGRSPAKRDTAFIRYAEPRANALEKEISRKVSGYTEAYRIVRSQDVRNSLAAGEAALEFVSFTYFDLLGKPTDSTLYAALVLLPTDTTPHFIPLFEERQLQALFNRPGYNEELIVKSLYASNSELLNLLWKPLEPLLRDVKTIYYSPAGLLHRINPAALRDADKQPLSAGRQWVRVGSTRELVAGRLADRSFAHNPAAPLSAAVWGGIPYDMDSLAFAAANPMTDAGSTTEYGSKDGNFRYMVEANTSGPPAGTRGAGDDGWESLAGSAREAEQVDELLRHAGFHTEVRSGYNASEERFKAIGQAAPSPRILHVATHGFVYPDPRSGAKAPSFRRGLGEVEPAYKLQDDPMLRSGLLLAGANYYWTNKRPLANREDGVLVAYEVRDLNLSNTELAVLSACQTGLGDVVGSEGVYGLQRAFRIAGARFLIVSLWQVPDTQTQELMRLFYENWVDKRESLREAFNHAQANLREQEPNPYMWAGFVLIE